MKKVLLATTVLAGFASAAVADDATKVNISGYGRFGIVNNSAAGAGAAKTQVVNRLRFNIDASTTTDSGVKFGARLRLQNTSTSYGGTVGNDALLYTEYEGLRVEVGNTNTAYDNTTLLWNSEMGYRDTSFGDPFEFTYYYDSTPGSSKSMAGSVLANTVPPTLNANSYMGLYASYSVGDFYGQISYVNPDQTLKNLPAGVKSELSIAAAYKWGPVSVEGSIVQNGAGIDGNDPWFIGAAYAINDKANVGLNYIDEHMGATALANQTLVYGSAVDPGKTTTLYGNYKMDAITLKAYVAHNDAPTNKTDNAFGIGADYDLGGARLSGSIQRGYGVTGGKTPTVVDLGVRFDF
ncbi:MAG: porin [Proteobacteria bacterium]|nr:porin [Pseudomonadota bacterium]MBS0572179.1 porin [Pseudomonadota bacterium]